MHNVNNKLVVNFDCVGEGNCVFFVHNKTTRKKYLEPIGSSTSKDDKYTVHLIKGGLFTFPSDQLHFSNGVGVATAKMFPLGGYSAGRLHTGNDRVLNYPPLKCRAYKINVWN